MFSNDNFQHEIYIYKLILHVIAIFSLLSTTLAVYMILWKSSPQMGTYKWYLLNIVYWSALLDFYVSVLYVPTPMFPAIGLCTQGWFASFNIFEVKQVQFVFFAWIMGGVAASIMLAFVYRLAAITRSIPRLHKKTTMMLIVFIHLFMPTPIIVVGLYTTSYDYQSVLGEIKEKFPLIYEFSLTHSCIFHSFKVTPIACVLFGVFTFITLSTCVIIAISLVYVILHKINVNKKKMSSKTLALHRQLTFGLVVQLFVPISIVALPFLVLTILFLREDLDSLSARISGSLLFIISSSHSTINCISMVLMTKPYRTALLNKLFSPFNTTDAITVMVVGDVTSMAYQNGGVSRHPRYRQRSSK